MPMLISYNPADGTEVGRVPTTHPNDVPRLVESARAASPRWQELAAVERAALLTRAGQRLVERAEELGEQLSREMGKPRARGIGEVRSAGGSIAKKAEQARQALAPVTHDSETRRTTIHYDPLGVCACIAPWNYPVSMPNWMTVPALMAGNTVVLKPSEETPLSGQAYVDTLNEVLPDGVLQICHGGDEVGAALVAADVSLIAFTGSRAVGKKIMRAAAGHLKRLVLELGGKDPLIVLSDADIEQAARFAVANGFDNAGQMCVSTERVFVAEAVAPAFEERVARLAEEQVVGPWNMDGAQIGPMIHEQQRQQVIGQIEDAVRRGARVVTGGTEHPERYVRPTVLAEVTDDMEIAKEETFGPVLCISTYSEEDEAVRRANAGPYGLGAAVFGKDEARAEAVARRLDAGMIGINGGIFGVGDVPWVGAKESGFGYHGSPDGHRQFAQARAVTRHRPS